MKSSKEEKKDKHGRVDFKKLKKSADKLKVDTKRKEIDDNILKRVVRYLNNKTVIEKKEVHACLFRAV